MMNRRYVLDVVTRAAAALFLLLLAAVSSAPVAAASLDEAKAAGYLGERPDGYVGLVKDDVPDWARQLANQINTQRREKYADAGQRTPGTTVREMGLIAGRKMSGRRSGGH